MSLVLLAYLLVLFIELIAEHINEPYRFFYKSSTMQKSPLVKLTPRQIDNKGILTISCDTQAFSSPDYRITDESGRVIRQGTITNGMHELKLFIVGFRTGNYQIIIGSETLRFTVM